MTIQECIKQLESLRAHCDVMDDGKLDSMDCWDKDVQALDMALDLMKSNAGFGFACVQGSPDVALAPELEWLPELVTEICPHCESEVTLEWDVEERGYKAYCPVCGGRLMLCDECQHRGPGGECTGDCDYNSETDSCRFNHPGDDRYERRGGKSTVICYVPKSVTDAVKSRPDWPEIEAAMKRAYGSDWRLVSCDEPMHPAEAGEMEDSMENEYISRTELFKLMQRNPDLPVVPMIDGETCGDDEYARYVGSWGESYVAEYIVGEGVVHFRESDPDMCEVEDVLTDGFVSYDDLECMPDEEAKSEYAALPWIKAIIVNIDLPE